MESRKKGTSSIQYNKGRIGHILCRNWILKLVIEGKIEEKGGGEEEDVSSYWMTLGKEKIKKASVHIGCRTCFQTDYRSF
jgi:hypothetical protein